MTTKKNINNPTGTGKLGRTPAKALFENGTYDLELFHDRFIDLEDPTEYKPAIELVGSWSEWERLKRDWKGFNTYIIAWKEELDIKLKSDAFARINTLAASDHYQANKWVAEEGYSEKARAGRPSKKEKQQAAKEIAKDAAETKEEKNRVLQLVNSSDGR